MPTLTQNSLIDSRGRILPPERTSRGNFYGSMWTARLGYRDGNLVRDTEIRPNADFPLFLFAQDALVILKATSYWTGGYLAHGGVWYPVPNFSYADEIRPVGVPAAIVWGPLVIPAQATYPHGQIVTGTTATAGVAVKGFMAYAECAGHNISGSFEADEPTNAQKYVVDCWTKGAVMDGPADYDPSMETYALYDITETVILRESDYTQAMANADNQIVITAPGIPFALRYLICGLYCEDDVAPEDPQ